MAASAATMALMESLSLRGSSFQEFNGLVAAPSARPSMLPSPAHSRSFSVVLLPAFHEFAFWVEFMRF